MSRFERAESIAYGLGAGFKKSLFQPYLALYKRSKGQPYEGRLRHLLAGPLARGVVAGAAMGGATAVKSILTGQIDYEGFELSRKFVVGIPYFEYIGWLITGVLVLPLTAGAVHYFSKRNES